jgi:hypothetical protein
MKRTLQRISYLFLFFLLFSFTHSSKPDDLTFILGSWKTESITKQDGTIETGRKTITFKKNNTYVSVGEENEINTGTWKFTSGGTVLKMSESSTNKWENYKVDELTKEVLILIDELQKISFSKRKPAL